jgi:hypothetical protein
VVTLTANPAGGFTFLRWEGDVEGLNATTSITLSADKSVTAVFLKSADAADTTVPAGVDTELVVETPAGLPTAKLAITGNAMPGTVRAVVTQAADHPVQSYAGFADGLALSKRLTLASDMANGSFTAVIELYYTDEELGSLPENRLRIFHWNETTAAWEPAGSNDMGDTAPTATLGDYGVDTANNRVWAVVDHFSDFAAGLIAAQSDEPGDDSQTPETPTYLFCGACGAGAELLMLMGFLGAGLVRIGRGRHGRG